MRSEPRLFIFRQVPPRPKSTHPPRIGSSAAPRDRYAAFYSTNPPLPPCRRFPPCRRTRSGTSSPGVLPVQLQPRIPFLQHLPILQHGIEHVAAVLQPIMPGSQKAATGSMRFSAISPSPPAASGPRIRPPPRALSLYHHKSAVTAAAFRIVPSMTGSTSPQPVPRPRRPFSQQHDPAPG